MDVEQKSGIEVRAPSAAPATPAAVKEPAPGIGQAAVLDQVIAGAAIPPHIRTRYLMGALPQGALPNVIRNYCISADQERIDEVSGAWRTASARMAMLSETEAGLPDTISVEEPPDSVKERLAEIAKDKLFRASFSGVPVSFKVVDIDLLVAPQREVNLDHVARMRDRIPGTTVEELIEFCVGLSRETAEVKSLQTAPNQVTYTSKSVDFRFTGGARKPITDADIAVAHGGGQPVESISLLTGFGAAQINTFMVGDRLVLNNGFHRIIALRMAGVTKVPVVVQHISNSEIEFPGQLCGTPRAYLLNHLRPVVIKDFFDEQLIVELRLVPRRKVVKVTWNVEEFVTAD